MTEENHDSNNKSNKHEHVRIYADNKEPEGCLGAFFSLIKVLLIITILSIVIGFITLYIACGGGIKW